MRDERARGEFNFFKFNSSSSRGLRRTEEEKEQHAAAVLSGLPTCAPLCTRKRRADTELWRGIAGRGMMQPERAGRQRLPPLPFTGVPQILWKPMRE